MIRARSHIILVHHNIHVRTHSLRTVQYTLASSPKFRGNFYSSHFTLVRPCLVVIGSHSCPSKDLVIAQSYNNRKPIGNLQCQFLDPLTGNPTLNLNLNHQCEFRAMKTTTKQYKLLTISLFRHSITHTHSEHYT